MEHIDFGRCNRAFSRAASRCHRNIAHAISNSLSEYSEGAQRGFIDDTTFGVTEYTLGEFQYKSGASKVGYYEGTAASLVAGCCYGGKQAKVLSTAAKWSLRTCRSARKALTASKGISTAKKTRIVTQIANETEPVIEKVSQSILKVDTIAAKEGSISLDALSKAGQVMDRKGLTKAGHALHKHGGRPVTVFRKAMGNEINKNLQGHFHIDDILTHPNNITRSHHHPKYGNVIDVKIPNDRGIRYSCDGNFIMLLEP